MKYKINDEILWREVDDEVVIVDPDRDDYFYLNSTGKEIWELINKGCSIEKIIEVVSNKYKEDREKIRKDIKKFIDNLRKKNILR